jgi:hypothetical protein
MASIYVRGVAQARSLWRPVRRRPTFKHRHSPAGKGFALGGGGTISHFQEFRQEYPDGPSGRRPPRPGPPANGTRRICLALRTCAGGLAVGREPASAARASPSPRDISHGSRRGGRDPMQRGAAVAPGRMAAPGWDDMRRSVTCGDRTPCTVGTDGAGGWGIATARRTSRWQALRAPGKPHAPVSRGQMVEGNDDAGEQDPMHRDAGPRPHPRRAAPRPLPLRGRGERWPGASAARVGDRHGGTHLPMAGVAGAGKTPCTCVAGADGGRERRCGGTGLHAP